MLRSCAQDLCGLRACCRAAAHGHRIEHSLQAAGMVVGKRSSPGRNSRPCRHGIGARPCQKYEYPAPRLALVVESRLNDGFVKLIMAVVAAPSAMAPAPDGSPLSRYGWRTVPLWGSIWAMWQDGSGSGPNAPSLPKTPMWTSARLLSPQVAISWPQELAESN